MIIIFVVVLLAGIGAGAGMNAIFGKNPVVKNDTGSKDDKGEKNGSTKDKNEEVEDTTSKKPEKPLFKASQAMSHIYAMSEQIGTRPTGSVKASQSADYIVEKLAEYGYMVEEQPFTTPEGFGSRNVMGSRAGTRDGYRILIGAHYDSSSGSKGAVDNASGVGVVLELARVFSNKRLRPEIQFVFFGANLPGGGDLENRLHGSRRFIEMMGTMEKRELVGMIAIDSVASGETLALRTKGSGLQRMKTKLETYARENGIEVALIKATTDSDNIPFEDAEVPAAWVEWCDSNGKITADDTYNSVLAGKVEQVGQLMEEFLFDITPDDLEELKY